MTINTNCQCLSLLSLAHTIPFNYHSYGSLYILLKSWWILYAMVPSPLSFEQCFIVNLKLKFWYLNLNFKSTMNDNSNNDDDGTIVYNV